MRPYNVWKFSLIQKGVFSGFSFLYEYHRSFNDEKKENIGSNFNEPMNNRVINKGNHERIFFKIPQLQTNRCCKNIQSK